MKQFDVSVTESAVLLIPSVIAKKVMPAAMSRLLFREPNSVTELLYRMEANGLISKVEDLDKKNMVRVAVTDKESHVYSEISSRESIHEIMSVLSDEECQQLSSHLDNPPVAQKVSKKTTLKP